MSASGILTEIPVPHCLGNSRQSDIVHGGQRNIVPDAESDDDNDVTQRTLLSGKKSCRRVLIDSDSEEDAPTKTVKNDVRASSRISNLGSEESQKAADVEDFREGSKTKSKHRRLVVADDSDSEDERESKAASSPAKVRRAESSSSSSDSEDERKSKVASSPAKVRRAESSSSSSDQSSPSNKERSSNKEAMSKRAAASSDESDGDNSALESSSRHSAVDEAPSKGKQPPEQDSEKHKKSGKQAKDNQRKQAAQAMQQIRSDSQRRLRESRLNLPYHRPRQCTLKDFLERKKRLKPVIDELRPVDEERLGRLCAEREREIEAFYQPVSEKAAESDGRQSESEQCQPEAVAPGSCAPDLVKKDDAVAPDVAADVGPVGAERVHRWLQEVPTGADPATSSVTEGEPQASTDATSVVEGEPKPPTDIISTAEGEPQASTDSVSVLEGEPQPLADASSVVRVAAEGQDLNLRVDSAELDSIKEIPQTTTVPCGSSDEVPREVPVVVPETKESPDEMTIDEHSLDKLHCQVKEALLEISCKMGTSTGQEGDERPVLKTPPCVDIDVSEDCDALEDSRAPVASTTLQSVHVMSANRTRRLPNMDGLLKTTPTLAKTSDVIDFDDDDASNGPPKPSVMNDFIERCIQHAVVPKRDTGKRTITLSLVRMATDETGRQQLVADAVPVTLDSAADAPPGASRQKLRGQLMHNIRQKREAARLQREQLQRDHRQRTRAADYPDELPSEEEIYSEEEVASSEGESEPDEEDDVLMDDGPKKRSGFVDDEAEVSEDEDYDELPDLDVRFEKPAAASAGVEDPPDTDDFRLFLEEDSVNVAAIDEARPSSRATSASELFCTQDRRPTSVSAAPSEVDSPACRLPNPQTSADTQPVSQLSAFSLSLPADVDAPLSPAPRSNSSDFGLDLGPLRLSPSQQQRSGPRPSLPSSCRPPLYSAIDALLDPEPTQDSADLLSLCSGKFDVDAGPTTSASARGPSKTSQRKPRAPKFIRERMPSTMSALMLDDGNANMPLELDSSDEDAEGDGDNSDTDDNLLTTKSARKKRAKKQRLVFSDDEDDEGGSKQTVDLDSMDSASEQDEDNSKNAPKTNFSHFFQSEKKGRGTDFFDNEAELSGSEEPSDDEADGDELDVMDDEAADRERLDENKIREQVERMHYKKALDEDLRELKMFQQRFLEDGDMHGPGRERKFRWNNADAVDDDQDGGGGDGSDADEAADGGERDEQWRLERHERQKWLQENAAAVAGGDGDGATVDADDGVDFSFLKPAHAMTVRKRFVKPTPGASSAVDTGQSAPPDVNSLMPVSPVCKVARGSFLRRDQRTLSRLAGMARPGGAGAAGAGAVGGASGGSPSAAPARATAAGAGRTFSLLRRADDGDGAGAAAAGGATYSSAADSPVCPQSLDAPSPTSHADTTTSKRKSTRASSDTTRAKKTKLARSFSKLDEGSQSNSLFGCMS